MIYYLTTMYFEMHFLNSPAIVICTGAHAKPRRPQSSLAKAASRPKLQPQPHQASAVAVAAVAVEAAAQVPPYEEATECWAWKSDTGLQQASPSEKKLTVKNSILIEVDASLLPHYPLLRLTARISLNLPLDELLAPATIPEILLFERSLQPHAPGNRWSPFKTLTKMVSIVAPAVGYRRAHLQSIPCTLHLSRLSPKPVHHPPYTVSNIQCGAGFVQGPFPLIFIRGWLQAGHFSGAMPAYHIGAPGIRLTLDEIVSRPLPVAPPAPSSAPASSPTSEGAISLLVVPSLAEIML